MLFRQLRYFIAVAEDLNFTKAARRLQIAQPPLSRQIQALEKQIGVRLFERNSSRVFLTQAGQRFLVEARSVLKSVERAVEVARRANNGDFGTVRIGIAKGLGELVSQVINRHLRQFPGVEIDVRDIASGLQTEALVNGVVDIGFMRPFIDDSKLSSKLLFQERLSVVLRKSSPFARHKRLLLKHLADQSLLVIDRPTSPGVYDKTLQLYRTAGLSPKIIPTQTMPHSEAGAILVDSGKGIYISVGKNPCHPSFADRLVAVPLMEPDATVGVFMAWRKGEKSKLLLDFVQFSQKVFESVPAIVDMTKDSNILGPNPARPRSRERPRSPGRRATPKRGSNGS